VFVLHLLTYSKRFAWYLYFFENRRNFMKRRNFDYFCLKRTISVLDGDALKEVSFYVCVRLEDALLYDNALRTLVGLIAKTDIPATERGVTVDMERTFHCAASKRLIGHLGFTLEYTGEAGQEYPQWGTRIDTSIAYNKSQLISLLETKLYTYVFKPKGSEATYQIVPGTLKERSRRGER
jgi:hypothetical protein